MNKKTGYKQLTIIALVILNLIVLTIISSADTTISANGLSSFNGIVTMDTKLIVPNINVTDKIYTTSIDTGNKPLNVTRSGSATSSITIWPSGNNGDAQVVFYNISSAHYRLFLDYSTDKFRFFDDLRNVDIWSNIFGTNDTWFQGDVSALSFTDRTERSSLTVSELKTYLRNMDFDKDICVDKKCQIDKQQYPLEWVKPYQECVLYSLDNDNDCLMEETRLGRDLTVMSSDMLRLVQDLVLEVDALKLLAPK